MPKTIESHPTNFFEDDLETHNTDRAEPYNKSFYLLNKLATKYNRDLTTNEIEKNVRKILLYLMVLIVSLRH